MHQIRVSEVMAALSLTTDLAGGMQFEKGLSVCAVATKFADNVLALDSTTCRAVFEMALLRSVGCTSFAPEIAEIFGDDVAFRAAMATLDPGDSAVFADQLRTFGSWAGEQGRSLGQVFVEFLPTLGVEAMRSGCEAARALGAGIGLRPESVEALDDVYERWDGHGIAEGRGGDNVAIAARVVHLAEQAVLAHAVGGVQGAIAEVRRRSGGHLDPDLVTAFLTEPDHILSPLADADVFCSVLDMEPVPHATVPFASKSQLCAVLARLVDLKSRWLLGHSEHVAALAEKAGRLAGLSDADATELHCAGLLHDIGRVGISSSIWERPGRLGVAEMERVRMHTYWTQRILDRVPVLAPLASIASAHHERTDGSGYHRGDSSMTLPFAARILAAADMFAALTEPRAHREAFAVAVASEMLLREADRGALDRAACSAVIEAASGTRLPAVLPMGLTEREVEVLRLAARGLRNREIGKLLSISDRTVGHHLSHIYDKTGRRTRAGVAIFGMEHGLLP
ncbi:HD domain-containing phosphohydrolase [Nocardia salmonicida]|uniref:HD domain-containing phosphohydrolase n=1 Tax=Nocardia salmonicida TaxID=53431 RepID=UPI0036729119